MKKAAFIDVDGTLTKETSSWATVHTAFDLVEEMNENIRKFYGGEIGYEEWAYYDVGLWKGRAIQEIENALLPPNLVNGAKEGISELKSKGYSVILLSGGLSILVDEVKRIVQADEAHANIIGHSNGILDGSIVKMVADKSDIILDFERNKNIDLAQCIAIGDNVNDVEMFEKVGKSLAINPKTDELASLATKSMVTDNFYDAVTYLLDI